LSREGDHTLSLGSTSDVLRTNLIISRSYKHGGTRRWVGVRSINEDYVSDVIKLGSRFPRAWSFDYQ